jgi:RNA polymerase sigma factor (sigma-70 family)
MRIQPNITQPNEPMEIAPVSLHAGSYSRTAHSPLRLVKPGVPLSAFVQAVQSKATPGLKLEQVQSGHAGELSRSPTEHLLLLARTGGATLRCACDELMQTGALAKGQMILLPAGVNGGLSWQGELDALCLSLDNHWLLSVAETARDSALPRLQLDFRFRLRDLPLERLVRALADEAQSVGDKLTLPTQATALALHLLRHYEQGVNATTDPTGLPPYQLERVLAFIEEHLNESLTIETLASSVCLSPLHFARLFRQAVGVAPHQYVIEARLRRAGTLLAEGNLPITQIALETGFANASHFTYLFRRAYALTPRAYRLQQREGQRVSKESATVSVPPPEGALPAPRRLLQAVPSPAPVSLTTNPEPSAAQLFEQEALPHFPQLLRAARQATGNQTEAEDVIQEVYLQAWISFAAYTPGTNCRAWLFKILFYKLKQQALHRLTRQVCLDELPADCEPAISPQPDVLNEDREAIRQALQQVNAPFRTVVTLALIEEFSYREIAAYLNIPIGTVMSRLSRGRALIKEALAQSPAFAPPTHHPEELNHYA